MALWEAGLVGAAALLVGGAVTGVGRLDHPPATSSDVADQAFTLPWSPLGAIVATCAGLTLVAALAGVVGRSDSQARARVRASDPSTTLTRRKLCAGSAP